MKTSSYTDYKSAIDDAFSAKISNPTVFWNENDGFYVAPSARLVPNRDYCVGAANYILPTGKRSLHATHKNYQNTMENIGCLELE